MSYQIHDAGQAGELFIEFTLNVSSTASTLAVGQDDHASAAEASKCRCMGEDSGLQMPAVNGTAI